VECTVTVTEGVTSSDCPTANTYCNTSTQETTGNFCSTPVCTDDSCEAWETCDPTGTGECASVACTVDTAQEDCATFICDPDTLVCVGCEYTGDTLVECPEADTANNTYYVCETTGMCTSTECVAAELCTPGQVCSNGPTVCHDIACTDDTAISLCSTYACVDLVCGDCNDDEGDDACPDSDSENDTYYVC
jgi:hypothetical protein